MAKKNCGYIKVNRDIMDHPIWKCQDRFDLRSIWIDLNLRANHSDQVKTQGNKTYILKRGQLTGSLSQFGCWWNMNRDTARRKLVLLEQLGLIKYDSRTLNQCLVTLVKYGVEQSGSGLGYDSNGDVLGDDTKDAYWDNTSAQTSSHYKNDKECNKNEKERKEKAAPLNPFGWELE